MIQASDPLRALGFSEVPEAFSFSFATLDPEAAIAEAQQAAVDRYGRELGVVLYLGVEGDTTEVAATLRAYGPNDRRPFRASTHNATDPNSVYAGLDPNALTAKVKKVALARKAARA